MKQPSPWEAGDLISQVLAVRRVGWNWRLLKFHQRADLITIPPKARGESIREKRSVWLTSLAPDLIGAALRRFQRNPLQRFTEALIFPGRRPHQSPFFSG